MSKLAEVQREARLHRRWGLYCLHGHDLSRQPGRERPDFIHDDRRSRPRQDHIRLLRELPTPILSNVRRTPTNKRHRRRALPTDGLRSLPTHRSSRSSSTRAYRITRKKPKVCLPTAVTFRGKIIRHRWQLRTKQKPTVVVTKEFNWQALGQTWSEWSRWTLIWSSLDPIRKEA